MLYCWKSSVFPTRKGTNCMQHQESVSEIQQQIDNVQSEIDSQLNKLKSETSSLANNTINTIHDTNKVLTFYIALPIFGLLSIAAVIFEVLVASFFLIFGASIYIFSALPAKDETKIKSCGAVMNALLEGISIPDKPKPNDETTDAPS